MYSLKPLGVDLYICVILKQMCKLVSNTFQNIFINFAELFFEL